MTFSAYTMRFNSYYYHRYLRRFILLYRKVDNEFQRNGRWSEKIADDPMWEQAIADRVRLLVHRDVNRPCVVIWSMGNESAYGCNFEKALAWTKSFDDSRLTQYESARYRNYHKHTIILIWIFIAGCTRLWKK